MKRNTGKKIAAKKKPFARKASHNKNVTHNNKYRTKAKWTHVHDVGVMADDVQRPPLLGIVCVKMRLRRHGIEFGTTNAKWNCHRPKNKAAQHTVARANKQQTAKYMGRTHWSALIPRLHLLAYRLGALVVRRPGGRAERVPL